MSGVAIKRPVLVWVLCSFLFVRQIVSILLIALFLFSADYLDPEVNSFFTEIQGIELAASTLFTLSTLVAALLLFQLNVKAFYVMNATMVGALTLFLWYLLSTSYIETINNLGAFFGAFFDVMLLAIFTSYIWFLKNKGVLS